METFYYYKTNEEVKIGDNVEIKRFLRPKLEGIVIFVYNPNELSIPKGDNPFGYSVKLSSGKELFLSRVDKTITLLSRGK